MAGARGGGAGAGGVCRRRGTLFPDGSATFSCGQGKVEFQKLDLLSGVGGWIQGTGSVDFTRNIDFRLRALSTLPVILTSSWVRFILGVRWPRLKLR